MEDRVEGRNAVEQLLGSGRAVRLVRFAEPIKPGDRLDALRRAATAAGVPVEVVTRRALDRDSARGAHQGVIAYAAAFEYTDLRAALEDAADAPRSLIIALDHVTDPGNLGAVVRTAEVAGADAVLVPKDRAASMTAVAIKTAAGAAEHVRVCREPNLVRALDLCREAGYWVVGSAASAPQDVWSADMPDRCVLVLGAEGTGLSRLTERSCDLLVSLPVAGRVDSLNVSAAAAVLAFEWVRRGRAGHGSRA